MELPAWLDKEAWAGWLEMRRAMKRVPLTDRAQKIALNQLTAWHNLGFDTAYILDESTLRGWRGLFINERTPRIQRNTGYVKYSARDREFYEEFYKEHPELKGHGPS